MSDGAQKSDLAVVGTTNPEPLNIVINTFADRIFNGLTSHRPYHPGAGCRSSAPVE
jgi:hypothetical protein